MFPRDFSVTGDLFPNSSPVRSTFDFDFDLDPRASPKSTPAGGFDIMDVGLNFPTTDEEERLKHWLTYSDKLPSIEETVPFKKTNKVSESRRRKKQRAKKHIVMHPFASCEDTEFCVKTLTALMNGTALPLTLEQEIQRISREAALA